MMGNSFSKDIKKVLDDLATRGWRLDATTNGVMAYPPDKSKGPVLVHLTPSDHRAMANTMSLLKRSGYDPKAPVTKAATEDEQKKTPGNAPETSGKAPQKKSEKKGGR